MPLAMIKLTGSFLILFSLLLFLPCCDHGLAPPESSPVEITGIRGSISYSHWPPADSLIDLRLVIFKTYPPDNILNEVISGNAVVYPGLSESHLPFNVTNTEYTVPLPAGVYDYVVVAHQYGRNITKDWQVVGQYDTTPADSLPTAISVEEGKLLKNINIDVDFHNLPAQPF
jgi:hypothetical protein